MLRIKSISLKPNTPADSRPTKWEERIIVALIATHHESMELSLSLTLGDAAITPEKRAELDVTMAEQLDRFVKTYFPELEIETEREDQGSRAT